MKTSYDSLEHTNISLQEKLFRQTRREQRILDEHKNIAIQAETQTMMSKYQLVFVKMETIFNKINISKKMKDRQLKQDALYRIKRAAIQKGSDLNFNTHMIYIKLRNKYVSNIIHAYEKKIFRM